MTISLVTGTPGAGKTLFTVWDKLRAVPGSSVPDGDGKMVKRRLVVGGIPDLLLEHSLIEVGKADCPTGAVREPGTPPVECVHDVTNWWLWCQPGDIIVVDECQRVFRPAPSGQKIPEFIAKLETHRHYGVDFIIITQHPQLLHVNVRNLVGLHEHVRRMFGGTTTIVYQWDHCTNPDRVKAGSKRVWRHKRAAFRLYKSSVLHLKTRFRIPPLLFLGVLSACLVPWFVYRAYASIHAELHPHPAQLALSHAGPGGVAAGAFNHAVAAVAPSLAASAPLLGCISKPGDCECIDSTGHVTTELLSNCERDSSRSGMGVPYVASSDQVAGVSPGSGGGSPAVKSSAPMVTPKFSTPLVAPSAWADQDADAQASMHHIRPHLYKGPM